MTRALANLSTVVVAVTIFAVALVQQRPLDTRLTATASQSPGYPDADTESPQDSQPRSMRADDDDDDPMPRRGWRHQLSGELPEEFIAACLEVAERIDPDYAARLRLRCDANPNEFAHMLRTSGRHLVGLVELREVAPDLFELKVQELKLDAQINRTVDEVRDARASEEGADVDGLIGVLRNDLTQQAMLSLQARKLSIERMKDQIQLRERELMRDRRNLEEYVEHRLQRLLEQ